LTEVWQGVIVKFRAGWDDVEFAEEGMSTIDTVRKVERD
jgi:hypothetical protein